MKQKIKWVYTYFNKLSNPIYALLFKFGIKKNCNIKFKDKTIRKIKLNQENIYILDLFILANSTMNPLKYSLFVEVFNQITENKKYINFNGINILNNENIGIFFEYFDINYPYDKINYKNREVIDIGANIGDTALIFANEGGKIHAFEPIPKTYEIAKQNINLNPLLKDQISIYNQAISCKKGMLKIYCEDSSSAMASTYTKKGQEYDIETMTIENCIKKYNITPDVLKMDCEGCEVEIINNSDLSIFKEIILEHHAFMTGVNAKDLIKKLEEMGFKTECYPIFSEPFNKFGIIYAFK